MSYCCNFENGHTTSTSSVCCGNNQKSYSKADEDSRFSPTSQTPTFSSNQTLTPPKSLTNFHGRIVTHQEDSVPSPHSLKSKDKSPNAINPLPLVIKVQTENIPQTSVEKPKMKESKIFTFSPHHIKNQDVVWPKNVKPRHTARNSNG